jgi:hypothetical protein
MVADLSPLKIKKRELPLTGPVSPRLKGEEERIAFDRTGWTDMVVDLSPRGLKVKKKELLGHGSLEGYDCGPMHPWGLQVEKQKGYSKEYAKTKYSIFIKFRKQKNKSFKLFCLTTDKFSMTTIFSYPSFLWRQ